MNSKANNLTQPQKNQFKVIKCGVVWYFLKIFFQFIENRVFPKLSIHWES